MHVILTAPWNSLRCLRAQCINLFSCHLNGLAKELPAFHTTPPLRWQESVSLCFWQLAALDWRFSLAEKEEKRTGDIMELIRKLAIIKPSPREGTIQEGSQQEEGGDDKWTWFSNCNHKDQFHVAKYLSLASTVANIPSFFLSERSSPVWADSGTGGVTAYAWLALLDCQLLLHLWSHHIGKTDRESLLQILEP